VAETGLGNFHTAWSLYMFLEAHGLGQALKFSSQLDSMLLQVWVGRKSNGQSKARKLNRQQCMMAWRA